MRHLASIRQLLIRYTSCWKLLWMGAGLWNVDLRAAGVTVVRFIFGSDSDGYAAGEVGPLRSCDTISAY